MNFRPGLSVSHQKPQIEPEYLYHRNINCTNQTYIFEIEMTINDECKSDQQLELDKPLLQI